MKSVVVEGKAGGVIYTDQTDGTSSRWGTVLDWDPAHRFVMAWQVSPTWQFEPELVKCSEIEVKFLPNEHGSSTLVELEHRELQRHGPGCLEAYAAMNSEAGWSSLLRLYAAKPEVTA